MDMTPIFLEQILFVRQEVAASKTFSCINYTFKSTTRLFFILINKVLR